MKLSLFLLLFLASSVILGQSSDDVISKSDFNPQFLEHLVKIRVDSVRKAHNCKSLINDTILFKAANFHADYMAVNLRLSHKQYNSDSTKTPQMRAEYFGAKNYFVGENVLFSPIGQTINKKGKTFNSGTYGGMADAMVDSWVNSSGHFKNIITKDYLLTGVSVEINWEQKKAYACQKFANILYKYSFTEDKAFFPYSQFKPDSITDSFPEDRALNPAFTYPYKLSHSEPIECKYCSLIAENPPLITLEVRSKNFVLKVENSEYVKELLKVRKSGFAVEIVEFEDYMCGNPDYYQAPSRRNGQSKLSGQLLQPLYRKDLLKGFKKRKLNKNVKFVDYILRSDSIPLFQRFGRYKLDKYSSEYFEINLGRVPKDLTGIWQHDLVYIQNNEICHIDYFTGYCGELSKDSADTKLFYINKNMSYEFIPESKPLRFEIPFEKGKHEFSEDNFNELIDSFFRLDYEVDSVKIEAFSSVEGDSLLNEKLQRRRAQTINDLIQNVQDKSFQIELISKTQWEDFYTQIKKHPNSKYRALANKSKEYIRSFLANNSDKYIEQILRNERKSMVTLYSKVLVNDTNLEYYIKKEWKRLSDSLNTKRRSDFFYSDHIYQLNNLYYHCYSKALEKKIASKVLLDLKAPYLLAENIIFIQLKVLVGHYFIETFSKNSEWVSYERIQRENLVNHKRDKCWSVFLYNCAVLFYRECTLNDALNADNTELILELLNSVESLYTVSEQHQKDMDDFYLNLNSHLLNSLLIDDPTGNSADASNAVFAIRNYHNKYGSLDHMKALQLAKILVFYKNLTGAVSLITPYKGISEIDEYLAVLGYNHPFEPNTGKYYEWLIDLNNTMENSAWCNLFLNECKIPFQAFNNEELRTLFCEECMEKNDVILQLISK